MLSDAHFLDIQRSSLKFLVPEGLKGLKEELDARTAKDDEER